jgi:hypothetical protein
MSSHLPPSVRYGLPGNGRTAEDHLGSRLNGWSAGISTSTIRTPSGSSIHISTRPHRSRRGSRVTVNRAATRRSCSVRTSRTCSQIRSGPPGSSCEVPDTSSNPWPKEEDQPWILGQPELPVNREPEDVAVEMAPALRVGRAQQNTATEYLHGSIAPRRRRCGLQPSQRHRASRTSTHPRLLPAIGRAAWEAQADGRWA